MERTTVDVPRPLVFVARGASVQSLEPFHPGERVQALPHGKHKGLVVVTYVTGPMGYSAEADCVNPHCPVKIDLEAVPQPPPAG